MSRPVTQTVVPNKLTYLSPLDSSDAKSTEAFCGAFSPEFDRLCIGGNESVVHQFMATGATSATSLPRFAPTVSLTSALTTGRDLKTPIVALRFIPKGQNPSLKNMLMVVCSDGNITHWHLGSSKVIHSMREVTNSTDAVVSHQNGVEKDTGFRPRAGYNDVYAADYNTTGNAFVTGGKDGMVRVYDSNTNKAYASLHEGALGSGMAKAHTNRIQALRFATSHIAYSGGWDYMLNCWDTRERSQRAVFSLFGPYICGDGIDVVGHTSDVAGAATSQPYIITASARNDNQVQIWDVRQRRLLSQWTVEKDPAIAPDPTLESSVNSHTKVEVTGGANCPLYCTRVSRRANLLAVGGLYACKVYKLAEVLQTCGGVVSKGPSSGSSPVYSSRRRSVENTNNNGGTEFVPTVNTSSIESTPGASLTQSHEPIKNLSRSDETSIRSAELYLSGAPSDALSMCVFGIEWGDDDSVLCPIGKRSCVLGVGVHQP